MATFNVLNPTLFTVAVVPLDLYAEGESVKTGIITILGL